MYETHETGTYHHILLFQCDYNDRLWEHGAPNERGQDHHHLLRRPGYSCIRPVPHEHGQNVFKMPQVDLHQS